MSAIQQTENDGPAEGVLPVAVNPGAGAELVPLVPETVPGVRQLNTAVTLVMAAALLRGEGVEG